MSADRETVADMKMLPVLQALAAKSGFRVITEADGRVLDAMDEFGDGEFAMTADGQHFLAHDGKENALCVAQFAVNAARKGKT